MALRIAINPNEEKLEVHGALRKGSRETARFKEIAGLARPGQIVPMGTFETHNRLAPSHLRLFQTNNVQIILQTCRFVTSYVSHLR